MRNCLLFLFFVVACTSSNDLVSQDVKVEESPCSVDNVCRLPNGQPGIAICHLPPGNEDNPLSLCVGQPSVAAGHFKNHEGDYCGACELPQEDYGDDDVGDDEQCPEGVDGCWYCANCECVNFCETPDAGLTDPGCTDPNGCEELPPVECTDPNGCEV
jgi:hypothetical protein